MTLKIDEMEQVLVKKKRSWLKEVRDFVVMFVIIMSFGWMFINAQLFIVLFDNVFASRVSASDVLIASPVKKIAFSEVKKENKSN